MFFFCKFSLYLSWKELSSYRRRKLVIISVSSLVCKGEWDGFSRDRSRCDTGMLLSKHWKAVTEPAQHAKECLKAEPTSSFGICACSFFFVLDMASSTRRVLEVLTVEKTNSRSSPCVWKDCLVMPT